MSAARKDRKIGLIIGGAFLLTATVAIWAYLAEESYDWWDHSYEESGDTADEPYGVSIFYNYLRSLRDKSTFHAVDSTMDRNLRPFLRDGATNLNYISVGGYTYIDSAAIANICQFVEQGNSFFLVRASVPSVLIDEIYEGECLDEWPSQSGYGIEENYIEDTLVRANFMHPDLHRVEDFEFANRVEAHYENFLWNYIYDELFCDAEQGMTVLATIDEHVNFVRIPHGDGFFYLHTSPKFFSNYYMVHEDGSDYAERAMAHLAPGDIIYDKLEWKFEYNPQTDSYGQQDGPFRYLLSQRGLRWGLYVLLGTVALMLLFAFRRKQRMIPVIHPKENTSLEYVETITELYYQQGSHGKILSHLQEQFLLFVRKRYRLSTSDLGASFVKSLAAQSGVQAVHLDQILAIQQKGSYAPNVKAEMLVEYYRLLNHFYEHCK